MRKRFAIAALALLSMPVATTQAVARDHHYHGHDRNYRYHCKKSKGTTGLIAGGAGGALAGHALGGGTLGTVAGGVGGALLGKHLDKKHDAAQNRRNGC
jgi:isoaspartyl peptidase/L-asparaginase-like protein (Ntn-hydrolase superfamily)